MEQHIRPNQDHFMRKFNETHREQFNEQLFTRNNEDMIDSMLKVIYSCQRDKYFTLRVTSVRIITDYEQIYNTLRDHEESRKRKNAPKDNYYDYIDMKDSDIMLIEVKYLVRHNGVEKQEIDGKTVDVKNPQEILTVLIAVPRFVNKYYFRLNGVLYTSTMQIVDGSTYNNSTSNNSKVDSNTMKTMFQPIAMFRGLRSLTDFYTGEVVDKMIVYNSVIFNNHVNVMYYILANYGFYRTCDFFGIHCVSVTDTPVTDPNYYCFKKHNLFVSYPKCMKDPMVQSFAITIYDAIGKDTTLDLIYNIRFWLINLGACYKNASIDKGLFVLDSVESVYDLITKEQLHLPESEKRTVYHLLRWMMREFVGLRAKDNVDVTTKKYRITDYCAVAYAMKVARGIHRVSDMGKRVTLHSVIKAVYTHPMYVIQQITRSMTNLISYQDMVNDNDATTALKWTYKGIQGLGDDGTSVQPGYRYVNPSHIGILDLDSSPTSDPGMSGMLCPMVQMYGNSFSDYQEPNTWYDTWGKEQEAYEHRKPVITPVHFDKEDTFEDFDLKQKVVDESLEIFKIRCPIYNVNPNIKYYDYEDLIEAEDKKVPVKSSLFTIIDDKDKGGT